MMTVEGFCCHARNLDADDGVPTRPITIYISYSSKSLKAAHSGLFLSNIHIHPPTPATRNQTNQ